MFCLFYTPEGKSEFGVIINNEVFQTIEITINPVKKYTLQSIFNIKVKKNDIVTVYVKCSEG